MPRRPVLEAAPEGSTAAASAAALFACRQQPLTKAANKHKARTEPEDQSAAQEDTPEDESATPAGPKPKKQRSGTESARKWKESWKDDSRLKHGQQWAFYDPATRMIKCKACILYGTKSNNLVVGTVSMKLERLLDHQTWADTNGHADALYKQADECK